MGVLCSVETEWKKRTLFDGVKQHLVKSLLKSGLKKLHHDTWHILMKILKKIDLTGEEIFSTNWTSMISRTE